MGGLMGSVPFLHLVFLRPSGKDLRFILIANCQSGVYNIRHLKEILGGTRKILQRGSAWNFADSKILT
jgi:hypothetical protein